MLAWHAWHPCVHATQHTLHACAHARMLAWQAGMSLSVAWASSLCVCACSCTPIIIVIVIRADCIPHVPLASIPGPHGHHAPT